MAGSTNANDPSVNAYRTDLMDAIGIVVLPPTGVLNEVGLLDGDRNDPESPAGRYFGPFHDEVRAILTEIVDRYALDEIQQGEIESHEYAQPPAAQGTWELAFWLWEHGPSILMTLDAAINVGNAIREATQRIRRIPESSVTGTNGRGIGSHQHGGAIRTYWSQLSVTAAVVSHAASRYGIDEQSIVSVFPRGNEYLGGPDHPNPSNTYLIRIDDGPRTIVYSVRADGTVVEHFQLAGDKITPLELPDLIDAFGMRVVSFPASRLVFLNEAADPVLHTKDVENS